MRKILILLIFFGVAALTAVSAGWSQTPKRGGILHTLVIENYTCGSSRNYTDYCSEATDRLIELQSAELDRAKRLKIVWEIQRKLDADVARPMLAWRKEYFAHWPHVKNLVPHNSLYNYDRMQDVWLDK